MCAKDRKNWKCISCVNAEIARESERRELQTERKEKKEMGDSEQREIPGSNIGSSPASVADTSDAQSEAKGGRKCSRVGDAFQCDLPPLRKKSKRSNRKGDAMLPSSKNVSEWNDASKMVWSPYRLCEADVKQFLDGIKSPLVQEQALTKLHEADYDAASTSKRLLDGNIILQHEPSWKMWTDEEKNAFNVAMHSLNDKQFDRVRSAMGGDKTLKDIIQFYYGVWKFTPHREEWRKNVKKRKEYHDEVCEVCELGGDLMCCDTCHLAFHLGCLSPPLERIPDDDEPWSCKYCIHELRDANVRSRYRRCIEHICMKIDEARAAALTPVTSASKNGAV